MRAGVSRREEADVIDTSQPAPGPWRMPTDAERRCRVYFRSAFRDCIDVCEVNPDLEETTDATMRLIAAAPDLLAACEAALASHRRDGEVDEESVALLRAVVAKARGVTSAAR
jgi:hypothetical protein